MLKHTYSKQTRLLKFLGIHRAIKSNNFHRLDLFALQFVFLFASNLCSSQSVEIEDSKLNELIIQYENCINENGNDCEKLFEEARSYVESIDEVSNRCLKYFALCNSRENMGYFDETALDIITKVDSLYSSIKDQCGRSRAYIEFSSFSRKANQSEKAQEFATEAIALANECGDSMQRAYAHKNYGIVLQNKGDYAAALKEFNSCYSLGKEIDDLVLMGIALTEMSTIHSVMGDYNLSLRKGIQAAKLYKKAGKDSRYARCILNLTSDFISLEQPDSVIHYLGLAEPIVRGKDKIAEGFLQYNLGEAYKLKKDYSSALEHYEIAEVKIENIGFRRLEVEIDLSRAECYSGLGNDKRAFALVKSAQLKSQEMEDAEGEMNVLNFIFDFGHKAKAYQESYDAGKAYMALRDSLLDADRQQEVVMLQEEFEAERREHEIESQRQENALLKEQGENERNQLLAIVASILTLCVAGFALYAKQRSKGKVQELENEKLNEQIAFKNRELSAKALHIAQKNEVLQKLQTDLEAMALEKDAKECVREVVSTLKLEKTIDGNWQQFTQQFTELNPDFYKQLSSNYEKLSKSDLRLAALLRMNLTSKDIALMLNISDEGVKKARQRFRKKLSLRSEDSLEAFIMKI